jgi:SnoaL-like domain
MEDWEIRAALDAHWAASDANDFELEHQIYREDAVLEYPQSAERIRGRRNIQASRFAQPSMKRFTVRRILGAADLWVTEFVLTYDGQPSYTVSIMEFKDGKVARETQYFGDAFEPGPSRAEMQTARGGDPTLPRAELDLRTEEYKHGSARHSSLCKDPPHPGSGAGGFPISVSAVQRPVRLLTETGSRSALLPRAWRARDASDPAPEREARRSSSRESRVVAIRAVSSRQRLECRI